MFAENERKVRHLTPATVSSHTALPLVRILSGHPFIRQVSPVKSRKFAFVINSDVQWTSFVDTTRILESEANILAPALNNVGKEY